MGGGNYNARPPGVHPRKRLDIDERHSDACCDDHHLHHASRNDDHPIGGCWTCAWVVLDTCRLLAANLATAAALCEAFRLGFEEGFGISGEGFNAEYAPRLTSAKFTALAETASYDHEWRPGCGRPARGGGK